MAIRYGAREDLLEAGHRYARVVTNPVPLPARQHHQVSVAEPQLPLQAGNLQVTHAIYHYVERRAEIRFDADPPGCAEQRTKHDGRVDPHQAQSLGERIAPGYR